MANIVILKGRLGSKPELRRVGSNKTPVAEVSLATSGFAKGEKTTDWHSITLWDKQAELICTQDKGDEVFIEGSIKCDEYTDKDGNKRKKVYIRAYRFEFCGSRKQNAPQTGQVGPSSNPYKDDDIRW